jgi:ADP-heptose:LPS heptosyltransferase
VSAFVSHQVQFLKIRPHLRRIALVNPTKFLGNLLLAGGLIQHLERWCVSHNIELLLVLDAGFEDLVTEAFAGIRLVYYPRKALLPGATGWKGILAYLQCVKQIRAFGADLAFTIEEDSVSHRLTHFSGAEFKVSSTNQRYRMGFDRVLAIPRSHRAPDQAHIWYSFRDVLLALELPVPAQPAYLEFPPIQPSDDLCARLLAMGLRVDKPLAVLHAGASKIYKKWPVEHFVTLAASIRARGFQLALIGAGELDTHANIHIIQALADRANAQVGMQGKLDTPESAVCVDLCNKLSLAELAMLLSRTDLMIGNDSGPSHLASALGVRGAVIFGPTDVDIWRPLGAQTEVIDNKDVCAADCTRHHCKNDYSCLRTLTPDMVNLRLFSSSDKSANALDEIHQHSTE